MDWKNQLTKTPYLVLFIVLITVGVGTASALITITFEGLTIFKENAQFDKDVNIDGSLNVDGIITGVETLEGINCSTEQIARFDGSNWLCGKIILKNNPITTVDSALIGEAATSIAIGTDGNPVISYWDGTSDDLKVAHCGNSSCSSGNTITTVDNNLSVGQHSSIAIGTDGNPVISYWDQVTADLKIAHCGNKLCSSGNTILTIDDNILPVGLFTSIAIGTDGNPVISYLGGFGDLVVAHCGNILCTVGPTITIVDSGGDVGQYTSIAIGTDGNPVISYRDLTNEALKVAHCGDIDCAEGINSNTITIVGTNESGFYTSITIGSDGNPVISYQRDPSQILKFVFCENTTCSTNSLSNIDIESQLGFYTSIAIGSDGRPVISYYDLEDGDLKVAFCKDVKCTNLKVKLTRVDTVGLVGSYTSMAIGTDNNPVISYLDETNNDLKVAVVGPVLIFE